MVRTSQTKAPKSEFSSDNDAGNMKNPLQPGSSDMEERMTYDYKEAMDDLQDTTNQSNVLSGDRLRHTKPQSSTAYYEPNEDESEISWRPDPSGLPKRTR
ncbi:hypothetical protein N7535_007428 [Penicillium sp. DV-2018c]|nr:hypothetical protein N7461_003456 [Penicillium sp. DV-2018c]KAJ5565790.1 hypothetical protein N7535_007428 [Penicillium sp. DV-2018c]